jgi:hypothetical protein
MDWNLNPNRNQRMADRVLDLLQERIQGRPVVKSLQNSHAVSLQDGLQLRGCVGGTPGGVSINSVTVFKQSNKARDKWFDAK